MARRKHQPVATVDNRGDYERHDVECAVAQAKAGLEQIRDGDQL